ncbi:unnamed protein product [Lactuca virosa]|uniref:glutathione transferase n=1 Tax=Lactuca virosa TaxID=75947 RepID=A0AAU9N2N7_9ASTR|nr:unnamed protein product [Lactuca virosa]
MADEVKLFAAGGSPFVCRVQIALNMKEIQYEKLEEDLHNKSADLLKYNPIHKKVPVLVHNGNAISESLVIVEYIDDAWKGVPILPQDPYQKAVARFWAKFIDDKCILALFKVFGNNGDEQVVSEACEQLQILENELKVKAYWLGMLEEATEIKFVTKDKFPKITEWADNFINCQFVKEVLPPRVYPPKEYLLAFFKEQFDEGPIALQQHLRWPLHARPTPGPDPFLLNPPLYPLNPADYPIPLVPPVNEHPPLCLPSSNAGRRRSAPATSERRCRRFHSPPPASASLQQRHAPAGTPISHPFLAGKARPRLPPSSSLLPPVLHHHLIPHSIPTTPLPIFTGKNPLPPLFSCSPETKQIPIPTPNLRQIHNFLGHYSPNTLPHADLLLIQENLLAGNPSSAAGCRLSPPPAAATSFDQKIQNLCFSPEFQKIQSCGSNSSLGCGFSKLLFGFQHTNLVHFF